MAGNRITEQEAKQIVKMRYAISQAMGPKEKPMMVSEEWFQKWKSRM